MLMVGIMEECDPYYSALNLTKRRVNRCKKYFLFGCGFGIPESCCCGEAIVKEISQNEADKGISYFTCKVFENDGWHVRKRWDASMEEEVIRLTEIVAEQSATIKRLREEEICMLRLRSEMEKKDEEVADVKKLLARVKDRLGMIYEPTPI